jgi:hypothetical protein
MNWPRKQGLLVHNLALIFDHLSGKPINRHRHYATCCFHLDDRRKTLTLRDEDRKLFVSLAVSYFRDCGTEAGSLVPKADLPSTTCHAVVLRRSFSEDTS